ncbi:MAG: hypothetical protein JWP87_6109 [Labilithrix sp.]|nr:hypothetical protein [Labilithrix sp.]
MLVAGALVAFSTNVFAAEHGYARLRYDLEDPNGKCANEAGFRARVVSRLGYDPFREDAPLDLRVRVIARGPTIRAEITSAQPGKPPGKRTLEDPRCDALGETLASAVALVLDPVAATAAQSSPPPPPPPPPTPPPIEPAPVAPVTALAPPAEHAEHAEPASREDAPLVPMLYADFTTAFARAPATLVGARIGAGLRRGAWSIAAEGHAETSPDAAFISATDRVEASAFSGAVVPCGHLGLFQACGVVTLGARQVKALDVVSPKTQAAFFVAIGARIGLEVSVSSAIALRANAELGAPLLRSDYTIDGVSRATSSVVEASLGAGILGRFR